MSAIGFYVFVYTLWLKRTTPQNIVIGGAACCVPVLVAWAAVTGDVGLPEQADGRATVPGSLGAAVVLGAVFLRLALRLHSDAGDPEATNHHPSGPACAGCEGGGHRGPPSAVPGSLPVAPGGDGQGEQRLKGMAANRLEEDARLLGRQRRHRFAGLGGQAHPISRIVGDDAPLHCLRQGAVQYRVEVSNR